MLRILIIGALLIANSSIANETNTIQSATTEQIYQAADLIGLEFTSDESELMHRRLSNYQEDYNEIRTVDLPNAITPAMVFDPKPMGFKIPAQYKEPKWSIPNQVSLPENQDDLAFYSVRDLAMLIQTKQITSVELTTFFINRLKHYNPQLFCVITLTENRALKQATRADQEIAVGHYRGLLHGIPYGAKDLLAVKGYPTTWGVSLYKDRIIDENAAVIKKLNKAGAVLIAKLTLGELAMGDVWYGEKTRNPWNTEQGSSGSSAGSASAVSAGLVPFAIGTETHGSIVSPSYRCGVTGLRPTFGRVSRSGAMALSWTMDKIGPIGRTVEDCAIIFDAIHGKDQNDPATIAAPFNYTPKLNANAIRVGYFATKMERDYSNKINDLQTIEVIKKLGMQLIPIHEPDVPIEPLSIILSAEASAAFDQLTRSNQDDTLVQQSQWSWPNTFRSSRLIPAVEYINANRVRSIMIEEMHEVMKEVDVIVTPPFIGNNLLLTNLSGHPCVVLPNGFDSDGGPTAITFIGHLYDEARLLAVAKAYQDATDHHLKHPELK